jgi:hypothetical protein
MLNCKNRPADDSAILSPMSSMKLHMSKIWGRLEHIKWTECRLGEKHPECQAFQVWNATPDFMKKTVYLHSTPTHVDDLPPSGGLDEKVANGILALSRELTSMED